MLTEPQIQRFSRQILLREVGGVGQERLLSTPVQVVGQGAAFEVARLTLAAGGTPLQAGAKRVVGSSNADVVLAASTVAAGCRACLVALEARGPVEPTLSVLLGSLAALCMQRLILGLAAPVSVATWSARGLVTNHPKCPHSP